MRYHPFGKTGISAIHIQVGDRMSSAPKTKQPSPKSAEAATSLLKLVHELAAELHVRPAALKELTLDSSLDHDLALDSLARMELLSRVEKHFGVSLSEAVLASVETPRDLLRAIVGTSTSQPSIESIEPAEIKLSDVETTPQGARTMIDVLNWHVLTHPDRAHIKFYQDEDQGEVITYKQLKQEAEKVAIGLQQKHVEPGQTVALMLPTGPEYFYSFFGILLAGAVPVPIYPPVRMNQLEDHLIRHAAILKNALVTVLITVPEAKRVAQLLKSQVDTLNHVSTLSDLTSKPGNYQTPAIGPDAIAFIQYTSGSTGNPKGVVLTHQNLIANIRAFGEAAKVTAKDIVVSWLPLYHDMGLIGTWFGSLYHSSLFISMSPLSFLSRPRRWLWAIHHYKATITAAPNFAYELCVRRIQDADIKGLDLSSLRAVANGAEPISPDTIQRFYERFSHYGFRWEAMLPVYGLAESSVGLAFPPLGRGPLIDRIDREDFVRSGEAQPAEKDDPTALRFVACGRPLRRHEIKIVGPTGTELPDRREGKLLFRGPSSTTGYFRNPEATKKLFSGEWLNSGDLAYIAGGDVYITGRSKDVIIHAGRNIYPHELEEAVGDLEGIRKGCVAVFGSADPKTGTERLVVLAETRETDPKVFERLHGQINTSSSNLLGTPPDEVILAPPHSVLKTSSGKIRRDGTRKLYEAGRIGKVQKSVWRQVASLLLASIVPQLRRKRKMLISGLYTGYAWVCFLPLLALSWIAVVVFPVYSWRWAFCRRTARMFFWLARIPITVHGLENVLKQRSCIFVVNHASYVDGFALIAALPRSFSFVAKAEFKQQSFFYHYPLTRLRFEFVERFKKEKGVADARRLTELSKEGRALLYFPEGTFTRMPGLLPFHMGAYMTAAETGAPVISVAMRGTRFILRDYSALLRRGPIDITIGKPIDTKALNAKESNHWTVAVQLRDMTRAQILAKCGDPDLSHENSPV